MWGTNQIRVHAARTNFYSWSKARALCTCMRTGNVECGLSSHAHAVQATEKIQKNTAKIQKNTRKYRKIRKIKYTKVDYLT